jgi:hypothetical protein
VEAEPGHSPIPAGYPSWVSGALPGPIPQETRATCSDCAMCSRARRPDPRYLYFNPHVKCCSYLPDLANYLTGGVLGNDAPEAAAGRRSVLERIRSRDGVTPLGLQMTAGYLRLYEQMPFGFGRSASLRCPHFVVTGQGGHCGIWQHRPPVCLTYFCKYDRGAVGKRFWGSLQEWLEVLEGEVTRWCAAELGAPLPRAAEPAPTTDPAGYSVDWGMWVGREVEYYTACSELVDSLDWPAVRRIAGPRAERLSEAVALAYRELLSDSVPGRLAAGSFTGDGTEDGRLRVTAYALLDPLYLSDRLARAIPYFAGQPWQEAVAAITAELGFPMDEALLRRLLDFGILVTADAESKAAQPPGSGKQPADVRQPGSPEWGVPGPPAGAEPFRAADGNGASGPLNAA